MAKWTGVAAVATAVGFGGYELTTNGAANNSAASSSAEANNHAANHGAAPRLTAGASTAATRGAVETARLPLATEGDRAPANDAPANIATANAATRSPAMEAAQRSVPRAPLPPTTSTPKTAKANRAEDVPRAAASASRELSLVDTAWAELRAGNPHRALQLIDGYAWSASERQFESEALLIRLEALSRSGQDAAARSLARRVLSRHSTGRLADKAQQVLDERSGAH
jgi:hypothetical protein